MIAALDEADALRVRTYARDEFRAGRSVRYCRGHGHPVVVCSDMTSLDLAMSARHTVLH